MANNDNYFRQVPKFTSDTINSMDGATTLPDVWVAIKSLAVGHYYENNKKVTTDDYIRNHNVLTYPHFTNGGEKSRRSSLNEATGITSFTVTHSQAISMVDSYAINVSIDEGDIDKIEALFMSPGISLIMEWGYRDSISSSLIHSSNPPDIAKFNDNGALELQYKQRYSGFDKAVKKTKGKYNYAIGTVINFSHSYNSTLGVYTGVISLVGVGYIESFSLFGNIIGDLNQDKRTKDKNLTVEDFIGHNFTNIINYTKELEKIGSKDDFGKERIGTLVDIPFTEYPNNLSEIANTSVTDKNSEEPKEGEKKEEVVSLKTLYPQFVYYSLKSFIDYITSTSPKVRYMTQFNKNMNPISDSILTYDPTEAIALTGSHSRKEGDNFGTDISIYITRNLIDEVFKKFKSRSILETIRFVLEIANKAFLGYADFTIDKIGDELIIHDNKYIDDSWFDGMLKLDVSRQGLRKGIIKNFQTKTYVPKDVISTWTVAGRTGNEAEAFNFFSTHNGLQYNEGSKDIGVKTSNEVAPVYEEEERIEPNIYFEYSIPSITVEDIPRSELYRQRVSKVFKENNPDLQEIGFQQLLIKNEIISTSKKTSVTTFNFDNLVPVKMEQNLIDVRQLSAHILNFFIINSMSIDDEAINNTNVVIDIWREYIDEIIANNKVEIKTDFTALPIDVDVTLPGVSGLAPFMFLKINGGTHRTSGKKIVYQITAVNETISNHEWTTTIKAMMRTDIAQN